MAETTCAYVCKPLVPDKVATAMVLATSQFMGRLHSGCKFGSKIYGVSKIPFVFNFVRENSTQLEALDEKLPTGATLVVRGFNCDSNCKIGVVISAVSVGNNQAWKALQ